MLPEVVEVAKQYGKEVVIDGGIMRGSHVLKALALGADCVFLGRAILWGITCEGQEGVESVLDILNKELVGAMKNTGCMSIEEAKNSKDRILYKDSELIIKPRL